MLYTGIRCGEYLLLKAVWWIIFAYIIECTYLKIMLKEDIMLNIERKNINFPSASNFQTKSEHKCHSIICQQCGNGRVP